MTRRISMVGLMGILLLFSACTGPSLRPVEVGSVRLIADGVEHEPYIYFAHGASYTEQGDILSASGIPFEGWLRDNLNTMSKIQYAEDLQLVVTGRDKDIGGGNVRVLPPLGPWVPEEYHEAEVVLPIPAEQFIDGRVGISSLEAQGAYIVSVFVRWSVDGEWGGGSEEFVDHRYMFKVIRCA